MIINQSINQSIKWKINKTNKHPKNEKQTMNVQTNKQTRNVRDEHKQTTNIKHDYKN